MTEAILRLLGKLNWPRWNKLSQTHLLWARAFSSSFGQFCMLAASSSPSRDLPKGFCHWLPQSVMFIPPRIPSPVIVPLEGLISLCVLPGDQDILFGCWKSSPRKLKDLGAYISLYMWLEMHWNCPRRIHLKANAAISKCEITCFVLFF